jgi:hypothetical protein
MIADVIRIVSTTIVDFIGIAVLVVGTFLLSVLIWTAVFKYHRK